jgi:hypothetical protein
MVDYRLVVYGNQRQGPEGARVELFHGDRKFNFNLMSLRQLPPSCPACENGIQGGAITPSLLIIDATNTSIDSCSNFPEV